MKKFFHHHRVGIAITLILLLGVSLRFFQLGVNPVGLNWDETAWGYNAYALSVDGKDEFGVFLPTNYIESFGDFKPPLYAYVTIIPIMLFGLTEFATRFASAFFGSLTILVSFFLVRKIFFDVPQKDSYALFTAFLLAISPWHIMLSRAAFEANLVTFFLVMGVWLFLKGVSEKSRGYLILAVLPFAASFYTFNTARIVSPLIVLLLGFSFWRILLTRKRKEAVIAVVLGLALVGPLVPFLLSPQASLRFKEVNIFSDIRIVERSNKEIASDGNVFWSKALHHRYGGYAVAYIEHYLDNLNPDFLFIKGDGNPKFSTQDTGQLYLFEIPFFIAGIFLLFRKKEGYWWIVPLWLLIGIIPAATARETPHALRIESTLPMFQIFSAIGIAWFLTAVKKQIYPVRIGLVSLLCLGVLMNVVYFLHGYYTHYPKEYSGEWQYGYKESIAYVQQVNGMYDEIYVSDSIGRPYVYYLFYTRTNPQVFRKDAVVTRDPFGFVHVSSFGKYHFPETMDFTNTSGKRNLYVTEPSIVPVDAKILKKFSLRNGETQLVAFTR